MFRTRRRAVAPAIIALVLCTGPVAGLAQSRSPGSAPGAHPTPYPAFAEARTFAELRRWLAVETSLAPARLVLLSADSGFAFEGPPQTRGAIVSRRLRQEVLNPDLATRLKGRSALVQLEFDCAHSETTVGAVTLYPGNSLLGGPGQSVSARDWMAANSGLILSDLAPVACAAPSGPAEKPADATALPLAAPAAGGHWAQIGAFAGPAVAEAQWRALQSRRPAETAGLSLRTEAVEHNGRTLNRALVGPFEDAARVQAFCETLKAHGELCLAR